MTNELVLIDSDTGEVKHVTTTTALDFPRPTTATVVEMREACAAVLPLINECQDIGYGCELLDRILAIEGYLSRKKEITAEAQTAARWCEVRIGELLGSATVGRPSKNMDRDPHFADLNIDERKLFRLLAQYRDIVAELVPDSRRHILRVIRQRQREQEIITPQPAIITRADYADWLPEQPDCDLLLTDPPYATDIDDITTFAQTWLPTALNKVKPTGRAYICIGAYPNELRAYLDTPTPEHLILANILVWTYRNTLGPSPKYDYKLNWQAILYYRGLDAPPLNCPEMVEQFSVQDINAPDGRQADRWHEWQKPDELAERFVRHSSQPGQLVLDPFACTGTFLLAAARLGRQAYGCEINPEHLQIAIERGCQHAP